MKPETLTLGQLAKRLGMSHQRVSRGIDAGLLPGWRVGHRFYIPVMLVEEFEETGTWKGRGHVAYQPTSPYIRRAV